MIGIKIRYIKTIQADFESFQIFGFLGNLKGGGCVTEIYWRAKCSNIMNFIIGIKINAGFEADFKFYLKDTFLYTAISEQCESKIEAQDEYCDIYFNVYKEILGILRGGENNGIRKKYKNHNKWSRNRNK